MNGQQSKLLILLIIVLSLYGCRSGFSDQPRFQAIQDYIDKNTLPSVPQVNAFVFQGWESLDNRHVTILSNQGRSYLVSLINFCNDLSFTQNLTLKQAISSQLSTQFDAIIVNKQHCRIKSIHQINTQQRNDLLNLAKKIR